MFIDTLIGKEFLEKELYELLLFDIEEDIQSYFGKYIHIYFERLPDQKIKVTEVKDFGCQDAQYLTERRIIEKCEWIRIRNQGKTVVLLLCRMDRSGPAAIVGSRWGTYAEEEGVLCWVDEWPVRDKPLTPEEMRQGFLELAGVFEDQIELQKLRSKRTV